MIKKNFNITIIIFNKFKKFRKKKMMNKQNKFKHHKFSSTGR